MNYTVKDRFLRYVKIDTQADPESNTSPSSEKQKDLTRIISEELTSMGVKHETNEFGYVYASLPSNCGKEVQKVFFCSHLDTAPDCSGTNVKPIVHTNYTGKDIILPDDISQVITMKNYPALREKVGHDIITASGLTLLGSDDKSGVAIIMDAFHQMVNNPELKHGEVKLLFSTDEEIGKGVAKVDLVKINADFGYTLDGGDIGSFENETFSANKAVIKIKGVSTHPGYAKGKMENALKIGADIIASLPKDSMTPETSDGMMGFIHPNKFDGKLEEATIELILRDFDTPKLLEKSEYLDRMCKKVLANYPNSSYSIEITEQYRNMKDVLVNYPHITDIAIKAMKNIGLTPKIGSIRGGTDGSILSHMGLPCPNLFAGEQAIHSRHEWVSVQDMERAVDTIIEICRVIAE